MADRIKGITVEIGGDTTGLSTALRDVNRRTRDLQSELKDVEKLLKFDPNNVELLAQRQQLLTQSIEATTTKLNQLREAEQQVQRQFERGEIGEEQYRAFRRELQQTEQALQGYQNAIQDMNAEQDRVAQGTRQLTTLFEATGSSVDDYANVIGQRLVRAIQNGTATSRDLEYAFNRIGQSTIGARGDIERLQRTLQSVDDGNSVQNVRREIGQIASEAEEAQGSVKELGGELAGMVAGLAAGGGIAGIIEKALDTSSLNTKIDINFDVPEESKTAVKEAIKGIEAYGIDAETALDGVRKQWALNTRTSDEGNAKIVKGAATIAAAYSGIDFNELIQETHEISRELGMAHGNALGLVNGLLEMGFPPDQLDIITEYGAQLSRAGYNASEIQGIFAAGVETGTWNIDNLLDGLKEGRIRVAEFGYLVPEAVSDILEGTELSASQFMEWGKAVAAGGEGGKKAMQEVAAALVSVKDETTRNALGTQVFGTMWEDQGTNITDTILGMNKHLSTAAENQEKLNDSTSKLDSDPAIKLQKALTDMQTALTPVLTTIAEVVTKVAEWVSENPKLAATITAIVTVIGILTGLAMALIPVVMALAGAATALNIGMLPLTGIILGVMAAIAAIIAIGVLLYKNWDTIKAKAGEFGRAVKEKFTEIKNAISEKMTAAREKITEVWNKVVSFFKGIDLKQIGKNIIQGLIDGIASMAGSVWKKAQEIADNVKNTIKKALRIQSPSRVMMELGEFTGEGLAKGLANSLGQINKMSEQMAKASIPIIEMPEQRNLAQSSVNAMQSSKQPALIQLLTPDKKVFAEYVFEDIFRMKNQLDARNAGFVGRRSL
jgi:phage-related minor tail protein